MLLQHSPNRWSCLITSAAMLLDEPVHLLVKQLGHDGSRILWPSWPEPQCYQGFHIQEIIELCDTRQVSLTPIEPHPMSVPPMPSNRVPIPKAVKIGDVTKRMLHHLTAPGILVGIGPNGHPHAAAWDGVRVFDPIGKIYGIGEFNLQTFWKAQSNQKNHET